MKVFLLMAAALFQYNLMADGLVDLNNRIGGVVDAPVSLRDGRGAGALPGAKAQLVLVRADGSLQPILPVTPFRTNSPAACYYVKAVDLRVPGSGGDTVTLRMRAWVGESFEAAALRGESRNISVVLGHPSSPAVVPGGRFTAASGDGPPLRHPIRA